MAYFKFHEKYYWESSKLTNSEINPSRENHACFISSKPPHKNHPRKYLGLQFDSFKLQHQLLRNLKFYQLHLFEHHCTWNFTSSGHVDPEEPERFTKCRVYDSKLSCEPGFASTGHSAQGKTLPKIACALNEVDLQLI